MKFQISSLACLLTFASLVNATPVPAQTFTGIGTFFDPPTEGGAQGACGPFADRDSQIVAVNGAQYGNMDKKSSWCGKSVEICYGDKCTVATVTDACPTCAHGDLDLTPAVWTQLEEDQEIGVIPITWKVV